MKKNNNKRKVKTLTKAQLKKRIAGLVKKITWDPMFDGRVAVQITKRK